MTARLLGYALCMAWAGLGNCAATHAQIITTIAGGYTIGYSGDNGPAAAAQLNAPWGAASDSAGNVFFVDYNNNVVRKISADGIITTVAGTGTGGFSGDGGLADAAQLNQPMGIAVDKHGNLFISDVLNRRVRRVDGATGIITTFAGNGVYGGMGDGGLATDAQLKLPNGIAVDAAGTVYIADVSNNVIRAVDAAGVIRTFAGNGGGGYSGDGGPATAAAIHSPWGLALDKSNNLYIAEYGSSCIRKVSAAGIITTYAGLAGSTGYGGDGGPATAAKLNGGGYLALTANGDLYISEIIGNRIRKVEAATGIMSSIAGNGVPGYNGDEIGAAGAELFNPKGVATDGQDNVYIADAGNNRIRRIGNALLKASDMHASKDIETYPNPVHAGGNITLKYDVIGAAQIRLYSLTGEMFINEQVDIYGPLNININVAPGVYFLQVLMQHADRAKVIVVQ